MQKRRILLLTAACAVLAGSCAGAPQVRHSDTGWQSDDVFRVRAAGLSEGGGPVSLREFRAKKAAVEMARYIVLEEFTAWIILGLDGGGPGYDEAMGRVKHEFAAAASKGNVAHEEYDAGGNCLIIYEVTGPCLRQSLAKLRNQMGLGR